MSFRLPFACHQIDIAKLYEVICLSHQKLVVLDRAVSIKIMSHQILVYILLPK